MILYLAAYHGKSAISALIKAASWSKISHVALVRGDGTTIEAWHKGGVQQSFTPWDLHTPGTMIDFYRIGYPEDILEYAWKKAGREVGRGYDFLGVGGFVARILHQSRSRWFCSELVAYALDQDTDGVPPVLALFNGLPYHKTTPAMCTRSPWVELLFSCAAMDSFRQLHDNSNLNPLYRDDTLTGHLE